MSNCNFYSNIILIPTSYNFNAVILFCRDTSLLADRIIFLILHYSSFVISSHIDITRQSLYYAITILYSCFLWHFNICIAIYLLPLLYLLQNLIITITTYTHLSVLLILSEFILNKLILNQLIWQASRLWKF